MPQEVLNWILGIATTIVTGLISLGFAFLTKWLTSKMKDKKAAQFLAAILSIIEDTVKETYQVYVETLKEQGKFDKEAQKQAKAGAIRTIKTKLTEDMKAWILENYGDIEKWIGDKIEVTIYQLKNPLAE